MGFCEELLTRTITASLSFVICFTRSCINLQLFKVTFGSQRGLLYHEKCDHARHNSDKKIIGNILHLYLFMEHNLDYKYQHKLYLEILGIDESDS